MRLVITGALGHIGSRLLRMLPEQFPEAELLLLDNLSTQRFPSLFHLPAAGNYRFCQADVLHDDLPALFSGADVVVHLAAITNAEGSFGNAAEVEQVNLAGTERVARACLQSGARLLFLSTTSVYGPQAASVDEDSPVEELQPQSPYAESKLRAERLLERLAAAEGLSFVTCRFGTIFGVSPGMRFHTAVNKFIWQACTGHPLTVWRSALTQYRPYLDLEDAVNAIAFLIARDRFTGELFNVVTLNATVQQIVDCIGTHVADLRIDLVDSPIMNQLSYHVAGEKLARLGFRYRGDLQRQVAATVSLLQGVRRW